MENILPNRTSDQFPSALKALRMKLGITRQRLCRMASLHRDAVRRYEEPEGFMAATPTHINYRKICNVLERELANFTPPEETQPSVIVKQQIVCSEIKTFWQPIRPWKKGERKTHESIS